MTFNDNVRLLSQMQNPPRRKVLIGRVDSSGEIASDARVYPDNDSTQTPIQNRVWVYDPTVRQNYVVRNQNVQPQPKLPVWIQLNDVGEWEVDRTDIEEATQTFGAAVGTLNTPERAGELIREVYPSRLLKPLRARATSGLEAYLEPGWVDGSYFTGGTVDLTSNEAALSTNEQAWVVVSIDISTIALSATNGTAQSVLAPLTEAGLESVSVTGVKLWGIPVKDGTTTLDTNTFVDLRPWLTSPSSGGGAAFPIEITSAFSVGSNEQYVVGPYTIGSGGSLNLAGRIIII